MSLFKSLFLFIFIIGIISFAQSIAGADIYMLQQQ